MSKILALVLFFIFISKSESSYLKSLQKCSIKDSKCLKDMAEGLLHELAENGKSDLGIPVLDPLRIKNQTTSVTGLVDVTLVDGFVEGINGCRLESFSTDVDKRVTIFDTLCDVFTIKGIYNLQSAPLINIIFGNIVTGDGIGSVVMDKLKMNFITPYTVEKNKDGEIYLLPDMEQGEYSYVMEKATFMIDHITLGNQEIAPSVTSFLNRNWKYLMSSFGRYFSDKGYKLGHDNIRKFFSSFLAKDYITEDLSEYVKLYKSRPSCDVE